MTGVIVLKDKDQLVSERYWEKVLGANKSCSGFAFASNGVVELGKLDKVDTLKEIQELHEAGKNFAIVNFFGNGSVGKEDLQPFVVLEKNGKPMLVAFLEGDFNAYGKTDSSHTNEYHLVNNILVPKSKQLFRLVKEDINQFMSELADPVTQSELINTTVPRGTITLIAGNGAIFSFEKNADKGTFPWGWTSNTYGYVEKNEEAKPSSSLANRFFGKKPEAKPEPPSIVPGKDTTQPSVLHKEEVARLGSPPKEVQGKGAIKKWYRNNALQGVLPVNWSERPEVPLKTRPSQTVKSFKELPQIASTESIKPKDTAPKVVVPAVAQTLPTKTPVEHPQEHKVPIIPAEHKKDIIDRFLKTVDTNSQEIVDPKTIQSLENKLPTFCEQVGLKGLDETFRWSFKSLVELGEMSKEALATLAMNYRTAYILTLAERPSEEKVETTLPVRPAQTKRGFKVM